MTTMTLKKSAVAFVLAAAAMFGVAGSASAQTPSLESLLAQIAALQAQIAAMQGGSSTGSTGACGVTTYGYTATSTLRQGMSGAAVSALQSALNNFGGASISTDGSFGPATANAVRAFQTSKGLTADGIAGPVTQEALVNASMMTGGNCPTNPTTPTNPMDLEGTDGTINDVNELSQYNNEEVGEGEEDVVVLGFEVESSNDGDIILNSVRVSMDPTGNTGSDNLDDYIDEVSVWFGDEKVGSADADEFSQNSSDVYTRTITLDGVVIEADEIEKLYVAVSGANSFDSSDISGDSWTVDIENIRFTDGSGVTTTDSTTGEIDGMDVPVNFVSFSDAADIELKVSKDSDSPKDGVVLVDADSDTDGVVLLRGRLKLEGDSDAVLDELPITFTTNGDSLAAVTNSVILEIGGEEYSESVTLTAVNTSTITFDNLDFDIEAEDTVEFEIRADINDINNSGVTATDFDEGDTLKADLTTTNRDYMDIENEDGDQLADSNEKSGTALGEAQEFRSIGIQLTLDEKETEVTSGQNANDDLGQFTLRFSVKAVGDAIYISSLSTVSVDTTGNGAVAGVERGSAATLGGTSVTFTNETEDDLTAGGNYLIEEGEEETFVMVITAQLPTAGAAGQYRGLLRALDWGTTDGLPYANTYTTNLDEFKTAYRALN